MRTFDDVSASRENNRRIPVDEDYDDDDDKYDTYDALVKHYTDLDKELDSDDNESDYNEEINDEGDNFYSDHVKFQHSQKKPRHARSLEANESEVKVETVVETSKHEKPHGNYRRPHFDQFVANRQRTAPKYPFLQKKQHRRRKSPMLKSADSDLTAKSKATTLDELGDFPAAHFQLNRKIPHRHSKVNVESYNGDVYIGESVWGYNQEHFSAEDGVLKMHDAGLYYIYAQICYNNTYDHNGFVIFHGHKPFLQCLNTVPTNLTFKIHTCHTSGIIYLRVNETIHLRDFHSDRNVVLKESNNRSFFGLVKIK